MRDQTVSHEMQRMDIDLLTEAKAVSMARQAEEIERQMRELTLPKSVDEVKPSRRRKPRVAPYLATSRTLRVIVIESLSLVGRVVDVDM